MPRRSRWRWKSAWLPVLLLAVLFLSQTARAQDLQALKEAIEDHYAAGRYSEAEAEAKQGLPLLERQYGASHEAVLEVLDRLAWSLYRLKRYEEAAQLHRRVIDSRRKNLGDRHALVARSIDGLARALWELGRKDESKALSKQGIAALPPGFNLPGVADTIQKNAAAERHAADLASKGKLAEAEKIYRESAGTHKEIVLPSEEALADVLLRQGRDREAFAIHQRMIGVWRSQEKGFYGGNIFASNLTRLAKQYERYGKLDKEALLLEMASATRERALGATHPETLAGLMDLGRSYERQGRNLDAFQAYRRVADAERMRLAVSAPDRMATQAAHLKLSVFGSLVRTAYALAAKDASQTATLSQQAFEAAQWATVSRAAAALTQTTARFAAGAGPLAQLVRELQDQQYQWQVLDRQIIDALAASPQADAEARLANLRARLAYAETKISDLGTRIRRDFVHYAELSSPRPLALNAVQPLLRDDEVLYFTFPIEKQTYAWIVTRTSHRWVRIPLGNDALAESAQDLRCGLDRDGEWEWSKERKRWLARSPRCAKLRPNGLLKDEAPPFNLALAHELYQLLLGQAAMEIKGKHLILVPSGPLATVPFQVLLTTPAEQGLSSDGEVLRRAAWLVKSTALTVLPSVASLNSGRQLVDGQNGRKAYLGVGNPLIAGPTGGDRRAWSRQACAPLVPLAPEIGSRGPTRTALEEFFQRGLADPAKLRLQRPLPETADELCGIAKTLGSSEEDVHLGARATERLLKELSARRRLRAYRVLHFATHGLLAGETERMARMLAEPALLLTPPETPSVLDDGLLTASEIAQLDLNAEWVVLSACNTAAGEGSNSEALSGLSRAFFYAGTRALLVSHWYVDSYAAVPLTTTAFAQLAANPSLSHGEALRRAMVMLIASNEPLASHPAFWAPFSVVGRRGS